MLASIIISLLWMFNCFCWYIIGKNKGKLIGKLEAYDEMISIMERDLEEAINGCK